MDEAVIKDLRRKLKELERRTPRLRVGRVTATSPLTVSLGASGVTYDDVKALSSPAVDDKVAVLVSGNDILVLGTVQ